MGYLVDPEHQVLLAQAVLEYFISFISALGFKKNQNQNKQTPLVLTKTKGNILKNGLCV